MAEKRGITVLWPEPLRAKISGRAELNCRSFGQEVVYLVQKRLELAEYEDRLVSGSAGGCVASKQNSEAG